MQCQSCTTPSEDDAGTFFGETVPGTGEVARFPAETLGTHKDFFGVVYIAHVLHAPCPTMVGCWRTSMAVQYCCGPQHRLMMHTELVQ
jgi:hypothetical protein